MEKPADTTSPSTEDSLTGTSESTPKNPRRRRRAKRDTWSELEQRASAVNSISAAVPSAQLVKSDAPDRSPVRAKSAVHDVVAKVTEDRYVRVGSQYYFPDTSDRAFRVSSTRTTTRLDRPDIIRDMLEIERARSDGSPLKIKGTDRFLAEAWRQAQLLGVEVRGYKPSELERAQVVRSIAQARGRAGERGDKDVAAPSPSAISDIEAGRAPASVSASTQHEAETPPPDRRVRGELLAHGSAPYQNNPKADPSYYVTVKTKEGKATIWGVDFDRAISQSLSGVKVGDQVVLQHDGQVPVSRKVRSRDPEGNIQVKEEVERYKNFWIVETAEFFRERDKLARVVLDPKITPIEGTERYPQLAGTYYQIRAAQVLAKEDFREAGDQRVFVEKFKTELAKDIALGRKMPTMKIQVDRSTTREPLTKSQQLEPTQERVLS